MARNTSIGTRRPCAPTMATLLTNREFVCMCVVNERKCACVCVGREVYKTLFDVMSREFHRHRHTHTQYQHTHTHTHTQHQPQRINAVLANVQTNGLKAKLCRCGKQRAVTTAHIQPLALRNVDAQVVRYLPHNGGGNVAVLLHGVSAKDLFESESESESECDWASVLLFPPFFSTSDEEEVENDDEEENCKITTKKKNEKVKKKEEEEEQKKKKKK